MSTTIPTLAEAMRWAESHQQRDVQIHMPEADRRLAGLARACDWAKEAGRQSQSWATLHATLCGAHDAMHITR